MINSNYIKEIVARSIKEDVGTGDITTLSTVSPEIVTEGRFIAKQNGVLCGWNIVKAVFHYIDDSITLKVLYNDGQTVQKGDVIAIIKGRAASIVTGERVALNFLQHLSGIATYTQIMVDHIRDYKAKIVDTRKTTPGLRVVEKYAVKTGGGQNHRFNLSDGVLIKDNHISASGGINEAIKSARAFIPHTLKIEVETETLEQVEEALKAGADIIMLDNMDISTMKEAVKYINGRAIVEASGNMDSKNLKDVAATGVDFISIGALTHSVKAMDISLKFE